MESIADPDLRAWVSNKHFDSLDTAVSSYQKLEKMMGAGPNNLLRLPADGDLSPETAPEVFQRLGMPADASGYEFHVGEGMQADEGMQNWAKDTFHKLGLSQQQADGVNRAFQDLQQSQAAQAAEDYKANVQLGEQTLQQKYGGGYDKFVRQGQMAIEALGMSAEMITALEREIGYEATIEWAGNLGSKLGEHKFELGDPAGGGGTNDAWGMSPDDARARYQAKLADAEWVKALTTKTHPQHKAAVEERGKLFKIIHGED